MLAAPTFALALVLAGLAALLVSEARGSAAGKWVAKPAATAGFLLLALALDAQTHTYGRLVLLALALSAAGDVLLIPKARRAFAVGIVAFLLAHVAYGAAFVALGQSWTWTLVATALLAPFAALVARRLLPRVPPKLKAPVATYVAVITAMVALALGAWGAGADARVPLGALLFYVSDLAVARQRFVAPGFRNRLVGLPLYYGAQVLLATTAAGG